MRSIERHRYSLLSLLLMLVMIFNIAGTTLFVHSHDIDGVSVVHSHPYSGLPTSHTHTSSHVGLIARLVSADMLFAEQLSISASAIFLISLIPCIEIELHETWSVAGLQLRAPPALMA